ncbi:type VI secretion system-associated FHA domain protein TagH [Agaribacterium sp. ZY112]|uniref:type VI secretion system-associated FHA domain protein TagH n=1 Tax=Agaribacterium sp. ZY112 TaxID=3233574 RepID=UPI0035232378
MDLILTVIKDPSGANMLNHTKVFKAAGGTIGRADGNDWVLPDAERVVSSKHTAIQFQGGQFLLADTSTNGTYVNDASDPLGPGKNHPLADGDIIGCGDYQLKVTLKTPAKADDGLPKGLGEVDFLDSSDRTTFSPVLAAKQQAASEAQELDSWLDPAAPSAQAPASSNNDWGSVTPSADPLASAAPQAPSADPLTGFQQSPAPADSFSSDPLAAFGGDQQSPASSDPLAAMDQAAGIQPSQTAGWADDDDWWKEGSGTDHSPANQHMMDIPKPQAPVEPTPAPVIPQPAAQVPPTPSPGAHPGTAPAAPAFAPAAPVTPAPQAAQPMATPEANPFAASSAGVQQANVDSALGMPGAPADPAGQFAQPLSPPPQAGVEPEWGQAQQTPAQQAPNPAVQAAAMQQQPAAAQMPNQATTAMAAAGTDSAQLAALLGLDQMQAQQLQQLVPEAAGIIKETTNRLIDLLRARSAIKNELRVQRTVIQTADNNPLKFSVTAEDALRAMFSPDQAAFMRPQDAVQDSFDDLSDHQVAVLSGMRAAYDAMFKHFKPTNLERYINAGSGLLASKKAKNWEAYEKYYESMIRDSETTYNKLFGEEFAVTYEQQLSELKNARALSK